MAVNATAFLGAFFGDGELLDENAIGAVLDLPARFADSLDSFLPVYSIKPTLQRSSFHKLSLLAVAANEQIDTQRYLVLAHNV